MRMSGLSLEIANVLERQGYKLLQDGAFRLLSDSRDSLRDAHFVAKKERVVKQRQFIHKHADLIKDYMVNGSKLSVKKISPKLIQVCSGSDDEIIYRWWNHVWWSLPYEKAYGRQMRYIVWDEHHEAVIGLIGLQSPILSWAPRDNHLHIAKKDKDYWVNQSMSIQRLGALPPYNLVLGGKLVAMLAAGGKLRHDFYRKYRGGQTIMQKRVIPPRLLFATTTGAFGKSSIYNRLRSESGEPLAKYIGDSEGAGSFHIPNSTYLKILGFLQKQGVNTERGYGHGPSRKMRLISQGMNLLGYKDGNRHGIKRSIYLFSYVKNLSQLIDGEHARPLWIDRPERDLVEFWKSRWALPKINKTNYRGYRDFRAGEFVDGQLSEFRDYE